MSQDSQEVYTGIVVDGDGLVAILTDPRRVPEFRAAGWCGVIA
jgi:hypothetical protein